MSADTATTNITAASRLSGAVWGHLVGDALGVPYEFLEQSQIGAVEWKGGGRWGQPAGTWSDDGGLMLALLDSLLTSGFDPEDQARRSLRWYRAADYKPGLRFDIGVATDAALTRVEAGVPALDAGGTAEYDNGNGSLMRILPVALVTLAQSDETAIEWARQASRVTHGHPRSQLACAAYVLVARRLLRGEPRDAGMLAAALAQLGTGASTEDARELKTFATWTGRGGSGYVVDCLWSAWDAFVGAEDYKSCVTGAVAYGEDTDTTACVAGGLAGAHWGLESIPEEWLGAMRGREIVDPLVARLLQSP